MNQSCVASVRWAVAVLGGVLLAACEATSLPAELPPSQPGEPLGTQAAELQASSSYFDLRLRVGSAVALGNTCGAANEVSSSCGSSGTSPDYNFRWMSPHAGNFTFSTQGSLYDTVLQLSQWGNGVSLGCNDNTAGTPQSSVTVYVPAGTPLRITVDGAGNKCGEFQLNITGETASCGTGYCSPPSACTDGFGRCSAGTCTYTSRPTGAACDDGNACTASDTCSATGACRGTPFTCNSPPGECYQATGTCSNGGCVYPPKPFGSSCADNACFTAGYCDGGGTCYPIDGGCCPGDHQECLGECCDPATHYCSSTGCRLWEP